MRSRSIGLSAAALVITGLAPGHEAAARPPAPSVLCDSIETPLCAAQTVDCSMCHPSVASPVSWNAYGDDIRGAFTETPASDERFEMLLPAALEDVEDLDSDRDGYSNLEEFIAGTLPGDPESVPSEGSSCDTFDGQGMYDICGYDGRYALRKVMLEACGLSPTREQLDAIDALDPAEQPDVVAAALESCMDTEYWRGVDGVVWRLAHTKVLPFDLADPESPAYSGLAPLNFRPDYALFVYTQIDGHDSRDLLLARYYVEPREQDGKTVYEPVDSLPTEDMPVERRAGMLTTRYYLTINNMFTALPRTAAAQAYRAYLGLDIALNQGLRPVVGEPVDYDVKGVGEATCAGCHSTLDPLSYPFSVYDGVSGQITGYGRYLPDRLEQYYEPLTPGVSEMPQEGFVLGQRVQTLLEWAEVAANSDEFAAARVLDYWKVFFHRSPEAWETPAFNRLVEDFRGKYSYSIEPMLRDLVRTEAYGTP